MVIAIIWRLVSITFNTIEWFGPVDTFALNSADYDDKDIAKMARKLGVALIGLGRHGRNVHFRNLVCHPEIDLKYIVEQDTKMAYGFLTEQYRDDITVVSPPGVGQVLEDKRWVWCLSMLFAIRLCVLRLEVQASCNAPGDLWNGYSSKEWKV